MDIFRRKIIKNGALKFILQRVYAFAIHNLSTMCKVVI